MPALVFLKMSATFSIHFFFHSMEPDITLHDVINHMTGMEQRLSAKIEANAKKIDANAKKIETNAKMIEVNTNKIDQLHISLANLTQDVQAIGSDMYHVKHKFAPLTQKRLTRLESLCKD